MWLDLNIGRWRAATIVTAVISAITGIVATVAPIVSPVVPAILAFITTLTACAVTQVVNSIPDGLRRSVGCLLRLNLALYGRRLRRLATCRHLLLNGRWWGRFRRLSLTLHRRRFWLPIGGRRLITSVRTTCATAFAAAVSTAFAATISSGLAATVSATFTAAIATAFAATVSAAFAAAISTALATFTATAFAATFFLFRVGRCVRPRLGNLHLPLGIFGSNGRCDGGRRQGEDQQTR